MLKQHRFDLTVHMQVELPTDQDAQQRSFNQTVDASAAMLKRLRPWQIVVIGASTGHEGLSLVRQV